MVRDPNGSGPEWDPNVSGPEWDPNVSGPECFRVPGPDVSGVPILKGASGVPGVLVLLLE